MPGNQVPRMCQGLDIMNVPTVHTTSDANGGSVKLWWGL